MLLSPTGMSDPNKWYDRRKGNSCAVKITFFRTGLITLPSLGKLFCLIYFPKVLPFTTIGNYRWTLVCDSKW
jgi:hypothetical protein